VTGFDLLVELKPETAGMLVAARGMAPKVTDPALLSLCADYVDAILAEKSWQPGEVTPRERAFLSFTEQFMISVSDVSDKQVHALLEFASPDEIYAFITALFTIEMSRRVELVSEVVLS
jgi:hypothetical protein